MAWDLKFKRGEKKYWTAGSLKIGKYGPAVGMKKTPELMEYINSIGDGEYINFYVWEPYDKNAAAKKPDPHAYDDELDSGVPF